MARADARFDSRSRAVGCLPPAGVTNYNRPQAAANRAEGTRLPAEGRFKLCRRHEGVGPKARGFRPKADSNRAEGTSPPAGTLAGAEVRWLALARGLLALTRGWLPASGRRYNCNRPQAAANRP